MAKEKLTINIKITGSGTPKEVIKSLEGLIESIKETNKGKDKVAIFDGAEWEDETLMTEITC
jgi:hypothetical protein